MTSSGASAFSGTLRHALGFANEVRLPLKRSASHAGKSSGEWTVLLGASNPELERGVDDGGISIQRHFVHAVRRSGGRQSESFRDLQPHARQSASCRHRCRRSRAARRCRHRRRRCGARIDSCRRDCSHPSRDSRRQQLRLVKRSGVCRPPVHSRAATSRRSCDRGDDGSRRDGRPQCRSGVLGDGATSAGRENVGRPRSSRSSANLSRPADDEQWRNHHGIYVKASGHPRRLLLYWCRLLSLAVHAQEHQHPGDPGTVPLQPLAQQVRRVETTLAYLGNRCRSRIERQ